MTRYFFHVHNSVGAAPDSEGHTLDGLEQAMNEAIRGVRSLLSSEVLEGRIDLTGRIDVDDEAGDRVFTLEYRDAVELTL